MNERTPESRRARAESVYAQELSGVAVGIAVDVDALAARHADLADELRSVHADWSRASGVYAALAIGRSMSERLSEHYGKDIDPGVTLQPREDPAAGPQSVSQAVIDRLTTHAPKRSRYEILDEVARGGMGAILKVWDPDLRRTLAMKVALTPRGSGDTAQSQEELAKTELPLARFLEEAQVTGQLDHPGVVPVHELGVDSDGRVFFTMRLVRGETFASVIDRVHAGEEGWTLARAVRLLLKICETVAYAHDKKVIHRDLKPANIMVGRFGEVYVMDWGLARVLDREPSADTKRRRRDSTMTFVRTDRKDVRGSGEHSHIATMTGDVVGTPAYMSPLQAQGEVEQLDERADVYSIGAILYHLLAGHMPYVLPGKKMDAYAIWGNLLEHAPHPLEERAPDAPPELVAICEKAMARKLYQRYPDVGSLAEDLHSFLDGRVVRAYERGALAEFRKWVKRNRSTAAASAAAIVVAIGGLGGVSYVQARANKELNLTNEALAAANEAERAARDEAQANEAEARREKARADEKSVEAQAAQYVAEQRAEEVSRQRDAADRVIEFLVGLFESPDPERTRGLVVTAKDLLDRGAASIESDLGQDPLVRARLMATMGRAYHELGLFEQAEPLLLESLRNRRERLGPESVETIEAENDLALLYRSQGRFDEAEDLYESALAEGTAVLGEDHPLVLDTKNGLARLERKRDRYAEAERLHEEVLAGRRRVLGATHPDTLETHLDLARDYREQNRLDEARELLDQALQGYRKTRGLDHPEALRTLAEMGSLEEQSGRFDLAEDYFLEAFEGRKRVLGEDHVETLWSMSDLAHLYVLDARYPEAEGIFEDALERHGRILGRDHPDSITLLAGLGGVYQLENRFDKAEAALREATDRALVALGPGHHRTLGCQFGLAAVYALQGRTEEAEPLYRDALAGFRRTYGDDNPQTLQILDDLVRLLIQDGRPDEASPLAAELVDLTPADDPSFESRRALFDEVEAALNR